ncbi:sugar transport protein [Roseibium hamelinense]|uniref:Sugar transport protein n=1 Tax=Roseibium hamelinense TaxID=150831 RepID=A0A562T961_9HYPH|nr:MFS transporter [Roseibium hamelinense]MTI45558.1 MFS transporter [Roseibium hamelinense]TWI90065.1 sugar transport protein [Roseibium hamelinense]
MSAVDAGGASAQKGVLPQVYIDETPEWPDGTSTSSAPLTPVQWRIWWLACAGKFFEGMVVFMTGIALPLMAKEFSLSSLGHGLVSSAVLFGILIGATALGGLSDSYGRRRMFIIEMILFLVFLVALTISHSFPVVLLALFGLGLALGCDYPTAHLVISESTPSRERGKLVLGAFSFQAVGALLGTGLAYLILSWFPSLEAWRWMYAAAILPAFAVLLGRFFIPESPTWLLEKGRKSDAEHALSWLLRREPQYPKRIVLADIPSSSDKPGAAGQPDEGAESGEEAGFKELIRDKQARRALILASVPWFLQDLGTYGIGIFTPVILATALGHEKVHATSTADLLHNDLLAAKGAAMIDVLLIVGIIFAILLTDRVGRIKLQVAGFVGCAAGLFIASMGNHVSESLHVPLIFAGFMLFNFMTNMGPNAQTYLIAGEVFPTRYRGVGAGLAASIAKVGAVTTAFLFPVLLVLIGTDALLYGLMATSLIGAVVTWRFQIETTGKSLAEL